MIKPDIIGTLTNEDIELKQRGLRWWAKCPLHDDKTPSFLVSAEKQNFRCWGCGAHGDVIQFIMDYRNLSFKESLAYLKIGHGKPPKIDEHREREQQLIKDFRQWEHDYYHHLCRLRVCYQASTLNLTSMAEVEMRAFMFHELPLIDYHLDILFGKDDELKFSLFNEVGYDF
jgi:DNA primase